MSPLPPGTDRQSCVILFRSSSSQELALDSARVKFDSLDVDGNGVLEGNEVLALADWVWDSFHAPADDMLVNVDPTPEDREEYAHKLLQTLDKNGDKQLDFQEFSAWFSRTTVCELYKRKQVIHQKRAVAIVGGFKLLKHVLHLHLFKELVAPLMEVWKGKCWAGLL